MVALGPVQEVAPKDPVVPVTVDLPEEVYGRFAAKAGDATPAEYVNKLCQYLMVQYGCGGVMLKGTQLQEIQAYTGNIETSDDVVSGVKRMAAEAMTRQPDSEAAKYRVVAQLDPGIYGAAVDNTHAMGYTIEEFINEILNYVLTSGMLYSWSASGLTMHWSDSERARLEKIVGKKVPSAADVLRLLSRSREAVAA